MDNEIVTPIAIERVEDSDRVKNYIRPAAS